MVSLWLSLFRVRSRVGMLIANKVTLHPRYVRCFRSTGADVHLEKDGGRPRCKNCLNFVRPYQTEDRIVSDATFRCEYSFSYEQDVQEETCHVLSPKTAPKKVCRSFLKRRSPRAKSGRNQTTRRKTQTPQHAARGRGAVDPLASTAWSL